MLHMVLTFDSLDEIKKKSVATMQVKSIEQYFPVVMFIMLNKVF